MKTIIYKELKESTKNILRPKVSLNKTIDGFLIVGNSFGLINFKTLDDAERGIEKLLNEGWVIKVNVKDKGKPSLEIRKTLKSIMSRIKK